jgi:hypothetical protein
MFTRGIAAKHGMDDSVLRFGCTATTRTLSWSCRDLGVMDTGCRLSPEESGDRGKG